MKLIDKDKIIAEIERGIEVFTSEKNQEGASQIDKLSLGGRIAELQEIRVFLDTLEVKGVDLEKEVDIELDGTWYGEYINTDKFRESAKHFFELGLKAQKGE